MTKTRIRFVVFGLVIALAGFAAGAMIQAPVGAQEGLGHVRLQINQSGALSCYHPDGKSCPKTAAAPSLSNPILTPIILIKSNPCYIHHNGSYFEVPCG